MPESDVKRMMVIVKMINVIQLISYLCRSDIIQILTAHEGNGGKLLSRSETQPWPTIHLGPMGLGE